MVQAAGRLAGACRQIGRCDFAMAIIQTMQAAGYKVIEENPFNETQMTNIPKHAQRIISPYHARIINMWEVMRDDVIKHFPKYKPTTANINTIIQRIDDVYVNDAYNSLSIEGYKGSRCSKRRTVSRRSDGAYSPRSLSKRKRYTCEPEDLP